jgi:hypothetical protein
VRNEQVGGRKEGGRREEGGVVPAPSLLLLNLKGAGRR